MRISDWSSDVCSSDLQRMRLLPEQFGVGSVHVVCAAVRHLRDQEQPAGSGLAAQVQADRTGQARRPRQIVARSVAELTVAGIDVAHSAIEEGTARPYPLRLPIQPVAPRSEERRVGKE